MAALIVVYYWWRRKQQLIMNNTYDDAINTTADNPYYSTVKSKEKDTTNGIYGTECNTYSDQQPYIPVYAVPDKQKKEV